MTKDIEREAFENWFPLKHLFAYVEWSDSQKNYVYNEYEKNHIEAYEYINASFSAWQAAKAHEAKKLEGCMVVPVEPTDEWMANYINAGVENYCEQFIGQKFAVTEQEKPSIKEEWRVPVRKAHAVILKVVEAARSQS